MDPNTDPPLPPPPRRIHHRASPTRRTTTTTSSSSARDPNHHHHQYNRLTAVSHSRYHDDRSSQPSSDPAFFSSDDIPGSGGLENYTVGTVTTSLVAAVADRNHVPAAGLVGGSRKRRYRGTWWGEKMSTSSSSLLGRQQEQQSPEKGGEGGGGHKRNKRVDFKEKRLVDSGVWMGSDDSGFLASDASWGEEVWGQISGGGCGNESGLLNSAVGVQEGRGDEALLLQESQEQGDRWENEQREQQRTQEMEQEQERLHWRQSLNAPFQSQRGMGVGSGMGIGGMRPRVEEEPREHQIARAIVNDCLEKGDDSVDLSGGNLRSIPSGLLRPLQHLTKLPAIKEPPVTEDVYTSLEPFLRLFLAGNALPKLSGELFELDSLRVLSLRNNKLTEIPPAIRRLTMLQEVNLSVNRLQSLPWELLWLIRKGDLKHLTVRPNPLLQIEEQEIAEWHVPPDELRSCLYDGPAPEEAWAPVHVATGPVRRYNAEGVLAERDVGSSQTAMEIDAEGPQGQAPLAASRVPSLREVALLSFSRSSYFELIADSDMADYPALMLRLLRDAREVRSGGGRSCSVCHRSFVIARTEWIEWWDCSTYENGLKGPRPSGESLRPLPFRRLGCSWGCVPGAGI
ncbi:leucine-rich repeat domain-containing protein [Aspergillus homomorphus CBS 101889]|uniref:Leucine rich repeat domain protein n=1 Tax=Aspergillus homomorphus (strain CBS 101889) TaxID=1450537 RepID=A0A395HVW9_ASPHC|nr:hypothetical protein BO97DRAFT_407043 [Aspergillus homomorphus CBS 101889]RAL10364.1 hypothetical protein BO97DRAFT_407043 [Aspergillus homomorphus CBS 101889]